MTDTQSTDTKTSTTAQAEAQVEARAEVRAEAQAEARVEDQVETQATTPAAVSFSPAAARRRQVIGVVDVLLSAVCFSLAGVLIKVIPWTALSVSGARSFFAAIVIYLYMRKCGRRLHVNKPILIGAALNYAMLQTFVLANKLTTAANAIVLQFTEPIWIILLIWIVFRTKPDRAAVAACAVTLAGIVCFFFDKLSPTGMLGSIIAIVSGLAYAGVFLIKKMPGCDFECAAIISFAACTLTGIPSLLAETVFTPEVLGAVVLLGVVQVGVAYIFLSRGLDIVSPVTASLTSTLEPVLNPILCAIVLGETIGPLSIFGCVLVLGSATVYNVYNARKEGAGQGAA